MFGSGKSERDWIYITDAAAAVVAALKYCSDSVSEVDIGSGTLASIRSVVERLSSIAGCLNANVIFDPERDRPDATITLKAINLSPGWMTQVSVDQGLKLLFNSAINES